MRVCVLTNFQKLPWGEDSKKALQKRKLFSQHHHKKNTCAIDISEGRLQSELIGREGGELSVCSPPVMGLGEVIGSQTLRAMTGLDTLSKKEDFSKLLLVRVTERGHHLPSSTSHF